MGVSDYLFVCFISALPGPPGVSIDDAYVQLFPINKHKCHTIDPIRDISYQLFTRHNPLQPQQLRLGDDEALSKSYLNFSEPTVLFFHAFFESSQATPATLIRTAYLQRGDHNIILMNAQRLEAGPWYLTASKNTQIVGEYTAQFIDYLVSRGLYLPSLHLTGLSLGAQMAGVCGQHVKSGRIRRITGRSCERQEKTRNVVQGVLNSRANMGISVTVRDTRLVILDKFSIYVPNNMPEEKMNIPGRQYRLPVEEQAETGNTESGNVLFLRGMDPAGPLFKKWPKSLKLDAGDADFVDIIHTDAGIFGYPRQIGDVDFWPNQGISPQPGCTLEEVKSRSPDAVLEPFFCSHWRSYQFFAESVVNPAAFANAVSCENWEDYVNGQCDSQTRQTTQLGLYVDPSARGNFFLTTNRESPFSKT